MGTVAWPPQVMRLTFGSVEVDVEVDRRADVRPDRGRGQVDGDDAGLRVARGVRVMSFGGGRLEHDVGQRILSQQPVDSAGARLQPELARLGQAVGGRVDPDHEAGLEHLAAAQQLEHQVGADVARPDDRRRRLHAVLPSVR